MHTIITRRSLTTSDGRGREQAPQSDYPSKHPSEDVYKCALHDTRSIHFATEHASKRS